MVFAFYSQKAVMTCGHTGQAIPNKVRFWIVIGPAQYVGYGDGVSCNEPVATDETSVHES